jgi:uncharacterized FlaG/YvyC family protein
MAENTVASVNRVDLQAASVVKTAVQAQTPIKQQLQQLQAASTKAEESKNIAVEGESKEESSTIVREGQLSIGKDTSLKFSVDPEKHEVTIMILDRATNKVIATIPQDAIKDMPPGEVLNFQI